jgi:hypothetical protein
MGLWLLLMLPFLLFTGCAAGANDPGGSGLTGRLTAANLLAGSAAEALARSIETGLFDPDGDTAAAIAVTLDAVEISLDAAGAALRAGLPDIAARNLGAAESQLAGLQPMLPDTRRGQNLEGDQ